MRAKNIADSRQDARIFLSSKQWFNGQEQEAVLLSTVGTLKHKSEDDSWIVSYDESDATGMAGTRTSLSLFPDGSIKLIRIGEVEMRLTFNKGDRQLDLFDTPYGLINLSLLTHEAKGNLSDNGGKLELGYALTVDNKHSISTRLSLEVEATN